MLVACTNPLKHLHYYLKSLTYLHTILLVKYWPKHDTTHMLKLLEEHNKYINIKTNKSTHKTKH